jgi:hypothetical protein
MIVVHSKSNLASNDWSGLTLTLEHIQRFDVVSLAAMIIIVTCVLLSKVYLKVRPLEFLENETKITFVSPVSYACSFFPFLFFVWGSRHPFCDRSSSRTSASRLGKVYLGQSTGWLGKEIVTVASGSNMN